MKILSPAFALVAIPIILLSSCGTSVDPTADTAGGATGNPSAEVLVQPEEKVDLYGKIVSMEGNEITISQVDTSKDPTFNMSADEKRKYMQSMDEAARMAFKETVNSAILGNVKATVPVGIPMMRKTAQWPDAPSVSASLSDLKVGQYVSIWLEPEASSWEKTARFVKISFVQ